MTERPPLRARPLSWPSTSLGVLALLAILLGPALPSGPATPEPGRTVLAAAARTAANPTRIAPAAAARTAANPTRIAPAAVARTAVNPARTPVAGHVAPAPKRPHPHRQPWPVTITVQTVPVLSGVRFAWDGQTATSDVRGQVHFTAEHNFVAHSLRLIDTAINGPQVRYRFVRWAGQRDPMQAFRTQVTNLPQRSPYTVSAAFSVQYPVNAGIVDENGTPVELSRISSIMLRDANGDDIRFPVSGQVWLDGQLPIYRNSSLELKTQSYSLQDIMVDGTNTVNVGEQSFRPAQQRQVTFRTKFFDLKIVAHDALFKAPTTGTARIRYPDGRIRMVPLGPDRSASLARLARGTYTVDLVGAGSSMPDLVTLSRSTTVDVTVATTRDLVTLGLAGLSLAIGLIVFGRGRYGVARTLMNGARIAAGVALGKGLQRPRAVARPRRDSAPIGAAVRHAAVAGSPREDGGVPALAGTVPSLVDVVPSGAPAHDEVSDG